MSELAKATVYLDSLLKISSITDWPQAHNGLQIENSGRITKIGATVDACEFTIRAAASAGIDFLLVHHGLFWSGVQPLTGAQYRRIKSALEHDLALYSAHLPLDVHPRFGNNALLCKALGFGSTKPFFFEKGTHIGLQCEVSLTRDALAQKLEAAVGGPVHVCPGGPEKVRRVGVVTGGAGAHVATAAAEGVDTFITGEGPHWSYTAAEELGINLLYAGHYATETFGVTALAAHLAAKLKVPWSFLDHPTGL